MLTFRCGALSLHIYTSFMYTALCTYRMYMYSRKLLDMLTLSLTLICIQYVLHPCMVRAPVGGRIASALAPQQDGQRHAHAMHLVTHTQCWLFNPQQGSEGVN